MSAAFLSKIYLCPMSGCWLWTASLDRYGYGQYKTDGRLYRAHRYSWALRNGDVPDGYCTLHKCDVRSCVNPDHLFLGSNADNMRDKVQKDRQTKAEATHSAKLNKDVILQMRALRSQGVSYRALGRMYGVSDTNARYAIIGAAWRVYAP